MAARVRLWPLVALTSPLWLGACGPPLPRLELKPGNSPPPDMPYPTHTPVFVGVVAMGRSTNSGCGGGATFNDLTLLEASCGEGCTVQDVTEEPAVTVRLALTATTPGVKTLDVTVQDAVEGTRQVSAEFEFLDVSELLVTHTGASDPGSSGRCWWDSSRSGVWALEQRMAKIWKSRPHPSSWCP